MKLGEWRNNEVIEKKIWISKYDREQEDLGKGKADKQKREEKSSILSYKWMDGSRMTKTESECNADSSQIRSLGHQYPVKKHK